MGIKIFIKEHKKKYSKFTLNLSAGYIDKDGNICSQQSGAEDTFAVGMPMYDEKGNFIGRLSVGIFDGLYYSEYTGEGQKIPVYYWKIEDYKGEYTKVKTYYQRFNKLKLIKEIPGFEVTMEALNKLSIIK